MGIGDRCGEIDGVRAVENDPTGALHLAHDRKSARAAAAQLQISTAITNWIEDEPGVGEIDGLIRRGELVDVRRSAAGCREEIEEIASGLINREGTRFGGESEAVK